VAQGQQLAWAAEQDFLMRVQPGMRTEWIAIPSTTARAALLDAPPVVPRAAAAARGLDEVADGASCLRSWCSSTISVAVKSAQSQPRRAIRARRR
jgi:hypothetical protein